MLTYVLDCGHSRSFYKWQGSMAKSHPEDRRYLCRFHPCPEILICLYEIFETGKKQDLTPAWTLNMKRMVLWGTPHCI